MWSAPRILIKLSYFLLILSEWYATSFAKYVQVPSFFCKALSASSPNFVDLNISLFTFFYKLIINNQGQFITEIKNYPLDKVTTHFHKNNSGVIKAMLRECKTNFTDLTDELEKIARDVFYS